MFGFDCVFYYVSNLDRSLKFYSEILGLNLRSCDAVARFDIGGVLFELVPTDDSSHFGGQGNARLTLRVNDLALAASDLASKGVVVSATHTVQNGSFASFTDPDGNELVIWQYGWSAISS